MPAVGDGSCFFFVLIDLTISWHDQWVRLVFFYIYVFIFCVRLDCWHVVCQRTKMQTKKPLSNP